jgi:hypothetical protein
MEPANTSFGRRDGFIPNPKLRLREQLREVMRFNRKAAVALPQKGAKGAKHGRFHRIFPGWSLHSMGETSCGRTGLVAFILRFLRFFAAVPIAGFGFKQFSRRTEEAYGNWIRQFLIEPRKSG